MLRARKARQSRRQIGDGIPTFFSDSIIAITQHRGFSNVGDQPVPEDIMEDGIPETGTRIRHPAAPATPFQAQSNTPDRSGDPLHLQDMRSSPQLPVQAGRAALTT